jgi:hypothetical protein
MAGQRVSASFDGHADVAMRHGNPSRAAQRQARVPAQGAGRAEPPGGHGHGRRAGPAGAARRLPAVVPAVGLPVFGALVGELTGSRVGAVFAVCSVLGAALAMLTSSRRGWWWVVTTTPVVILTVAFGIDYLAHSGDYRGTLLATHGLERVGHAFPVMGAAVLTALLVIVVRRVQSGRGRRG